MALTTGILLFNDAEELDLVGPWEVFGMAVHQHSDDRVVSIAQTLEPVRCAKGLRLVPEFDFVSAPNLDVLVVPGGFGTRAEMKNSAVVDWIRGVAPSCQWVTSVCTGSFLLHAAGLLAGKRATTHWTCIEALSSFGGVEVVSDARYVRDGNVVTAAGVSAGIDMALWLLGQIYQPELAREVQRQMEYNPAPPYAADV